MLPENVYKSIIVAGFESPKDDRDLHQIDSEAAIDVLLQIRELGFVSHSDCFRGPDRSAIKARVRISCKLSDMSERPKREDHRIHIFWNSVLCPKPIAQP